MKIGISLLRARPELWPEITVAAEELGYESIWLSEHLVIPVDMRGSYPGGNPVKAVETIPESCPTQAWPMFDSPTMLASLAAPTERIRFGTYVYLLGLRHPLITARAWATLDIVTRGRIDLGVGSGWLESEWDAAGMDWSRRGADLDESIEVCRRLWTEPTIEHRGETWSFEPVMFDPKPVQPGGPPIHIGGEKDVSLRRVVRLGDGWIAMEHTPETLRPRLARLHAMLEEAGRDPASVSVTAVGALESDDDLAAWQSAGVDRLIITPWKRSSQAVAAMADLAAELGLKGSGLSRR